jgi:predicted DNA-binding ribbon-helix-helix protein
LEIERNANTKGKYKTISLKKDDYDKLEGIARRYNTKKGWLIVAMLHDYDTKKKKRCSDGREFGKDFW